MHLNLLLGHSRSGVPQYWHDPPNPHAYLSGRSGMGKSHLLKKLVLQAAGQEAHVIILDYSGDLYGREITIEFYKFLRSEQKFPSLEDLQAEIRRNAEETRELIQREFT